MIDIEKYKNTNIRLKTPKGEEHIMSQYEVCRWFSLIEAVDIIDKKASQLGVKGDGINWVKPIALQKYIDERTESMLFELLEDLDKEEKCTT
jgi:hypothetical protein